MANPPDIPDDMLEQILNDPEAVAVLQELAGRAGITAPVAELPREDQVALVTATMNIAAEANARRSADNENDAPDGMTPGGPPPDALINQVFADPQAEPILRDIMAANQLTGEPADLPHNVKQAIVQLLIDQQVISFQPPPGQG